MGRGGNEIDSESLLYGPRVPIRRGPLGPVEEEIFPADMIGDEVPELVKFDGETTVVSVEDRVSGKQRILVSRDGTSSELGCAPSVRVPIATDAYALLPFGNFTHQSLDGGFEQFLWQDKDGRFQSALAKHIDGRCEIFSRTTLKEDIHDVQLIENSTTMGWVEISGNGTASLYAAEVDGDESPSLIPMAILEHSPGNIRACLDPDSGDLTAAWSEDADGQKIIRTWSASGGEKILHWDPESDADSGPALVDKVSVRGGTTAVLWHDEEWTYLSRSPGNRTFKLGTTYDLAGDSRMVVLENGDIYTATKSGTPPFYNIALQRIRGDADPMPLGGYPREGRFELTGSDRAAFIYKTGGRVYGKIVLSYPDSGQPEHKSIPAPGQTAIGLLDARTTKSGQVEALVYDTTADGGRRITKITF